MRRGFKSEAERLAEKLRTDLGLPPSARVRPEDLARHLGVEVVPADELVPREDLVRLQKLQPDAFSAGTFNVGEGRTVVVFNPLNEAGRIASDLAHELAHLLLGHDTRTVEQVGDLMWFTCDHEQEEEANWLAGCLLLPRPLLYAAARQGWDPARIAQAHGTSEAMARFRLNASGVLIQLGRQRRRS